MKKKLYEAGTEVIKVLWIYVILMAMAVTIFIGIAKPVLGVGGLVIAVLINNMLGMKVHIGGTDHGSE